MPGLAPPILSLHFAVLHLTPSHTATPSHSSPTHRDKDTAHLKPAKGTPTPPSEPPSLELVLYVAGSASSLTILEGGTGMVVGAGPLSTRHPSKGVGLHLLGEA